MKRLIAVSGPLEAYQTGWEDRYGYATPIGFVRTEDGDVPVDDLFTVITRPYWEQVAEVVLNDAIEKGRARQFSSRSEAGRYAAQVRWGNRNREVVGGEPASGLATGEFQTVLEPTDDAQEAIETGRPWRPLLDESMPPELRQIMAAFESSVRKSSQDRDLTDITGYNQVLEALTRHYEGVLAKGPWDQNLANKRYGSVWVKDGAVKPRQVAEEMAAYRFRGIRADAVRARTWHGTAEKSDEETKAVAGVLLTRQKHVVINMDDATVLKMIDDGRIKTQFETRTSGGYLGNSMRATHEAVHYGIHPLSSGAMRPVYGTIHANGVFSNRLNGTTQYGKAIVVLKPEVHNRTTFALNDTLGSGRIHNPLNGPLTNRGGSQDLNRQSYAMVSKRAQFHGYIEAQVHGGVGLGDIAMILMDSPQAIAKARAAMKAAGLPEGVVRLAREGKESKFIYPPEVAKSDALPMRSIMVDIIEKARERRFSSRSEAGRYAAQVRWGNRGAAAGGAERSPTMQAIADEAAAIKVEMDAINAMGAADVFGQIPRMDPSKSTYDRATAPVVVDSRDGELTVSPRTAELHDRTLRLGRAMDDEAHRRTEEELKSVEGGVVPDRNAIYAKHLQAVVAEVRPCNGKVEWVGDSVLASNPKIREQMDASMAEVGRVMPRDWTAVTGGTPIPVTMRTMGEGSSYNMVRQDITMALPKNVESRSHGQTDYTAVVGHEYTHHVEMTRPAVRVMEVAFVAHRTTGLAQEQTTRWKFVNGKQEPNDAPKAAPLKDRVKATQRSPRDIGMSAATGQYLALNRDHFAAAYSGRLYRDPYTRTNPDGGMTLMPKPSSKMNATSQAFEVLTTGVEQVFTGNRGNFDADHMSFVLGVMATA